jgi:hypothetical protein
MVQVWLIWNADSAHSVLHRSNSIPRLLWPRFPAHLMGFAGSKTVVRRRLTIQIALLGRLHHYHQMP